MSDPYSGDLYFLQKNHDDPEANIYRINGANDVPEGAAVGIQPIFPDRVGERRRHVLTDAAASVAPV